MLELQHISFRVDGSESGQEILNDVSFILPENKFFVLTGPNGGGKSTLARIIMGIETPTDGRIIYNGTDITPLDVTQRARLGIGYAFQQPPRFKGLTTRRLLELASGGKLPTSKCCEYLTNVGLHAAEYLDREVDGSLSGGEVKRIEIATLMARELGVAIFDEPEAGIDLWSFAMLVEQFKKLSNGRHKSVILISHQERIMALADEIFVIADGGIRSHGTRDEILPKLLGEFDRRQTGKEAQGV